MTGMKRHDRFGTGAYPDFLPRCSGQGRVCAFLLRKDARCSTSATNICSLLLELPHRLPTAAQPVRPSLSIPARHSGHIPPRLGGFRRRPLQHVVPPPGCAIGRRCRLCRRRHGHACPQQRHHHQQHWLYCRRARRLRLVVRRRPLQICRFQWLLCDHLCCRMGLEHTRGRSRR